MPLSLLNLASARLAYLDQAQQILATNIANIDTPSFRPRAPIPFAAILQGHGRLPMAVTSALDIAPQGNSGVQSGAMEVSEVAPDGNAVSLDQQLVQISQNEMAQQFTVNLYQSYTGMFRTALGTVP